MSSSYTPLSMFMVALLYSVGVTVIESSASFMVLKSYPLPFPTLIVTGATAFLFSCAFTGMAVITMTVAANNEIIFFNFKINYLLALNCI